MSRLIPGPMSAKTQNLTGLTFGLLQVVSFAGRLKSPARAEPAWNCLCKCGKPTVRGSGDLRKGRWMSCGCYGKINHITHGRTIGGADKLFQVWSGMIQRCRNRAHRSYKYYGGRGVKVCERWQKFANFLADMGDKPFIGATMERSNNDGDYCPDNCVWATASEQACNRRGKSILTLDGRSQNASAWAKELGISKSAIHNRKKRGLSDAECLQPTNK